MTEAEWLSGTDPRAMLTFLRDAGKASERKLRLFAVARCRRVLHCFRDELSRNAIAVAERFADGLLSRHTWEVELRHAGYACSTSTGTGWPELAAKLTLMSPFSTDTFLEVIGHVAEPSELSEGDLVRDLFGPLPFRPVPLDPSWLAWNTGTVAAVAGHIYAGRSFHALPALADALQDAGCDNEDILGHCRSGGDHVRGCWVVDLLLGRE